LTLLCATGPFGLDEELMLLRDYRIDALVAKDSGGGAVEAKLIAARQSRIPVLLLERPALPAADRLYGDVERMAADLIGSDGRTRVDGGR
jgi:precorrin-6A/cobalt-precorrin-6A reductase